jgi:hypothetical protein
VKCQDVNGKNGHADHQVGDRLVIFTCQCECHKEYNGE